MKTIELIQGKPRLPERKRVAAYARVSKESERMNHSLAAQVSYYSSLIQNNPMWVYSGVYSDEGISGTGRHRPGFLKLLEECEKGNIDIVLTKSISRFARNTLDLLNTVRHLKELGIEVRFEKESINTLSSDGELLITLLASFAQEESNAISENTKWGIRKRFEQGIDEFSPPPVGYKRNENRELVVDEKEAAVVRDVFSLYLEGRSPHEIAKQKNLSYSTVWEILRQTKYVGETVLQKTMSAFDITHIAKTRKWNHGELQQYHVTEFCPPIIDRQTFDRVQEEIKRRRVPKHNPFTSIITCSICGKHYRRVNNKKNIYYWKCGTKRDHGSSACSSPNILEKRLYKATEDILDRIESITVQNKTLICRLKDGNYEERNIDSRKD